MLTFEPLRRYCDENGIRKTDVKNKANLTWPTIGKIYNDVQVSWTVIDSICRGLNLPIEKVLKFVNEDEIEKGRVD
jgi:DNA-binding Xre family transcriptional regulator